MARAGDELDAQAFEVVVGIVEGVDLELAAVARAGVDLADRQRAAERAQDLGVQALAHAQFVRGRRRRLGYDADLQDLAQGRDHRSCPL